MKLLVSGEPLGDNSGMSLPFSDQVAIVTGATRGIGFAIARSLAQGGAKVVICGTQAESTARAAADLTRETGGEVAGQACDVRQREQVKALFDFTIARFGRLDMLVNNAGIGIFKPLSQLTADDWHSVIDINLTGVFHCCQEALTRFSPATGGYIFQIGSLAGRNPFAGGSVYNASKFGLNGFSEALLLDHRYEHVRVTTICPGSVDTDFSPRTGRAPWKIQPEDIAQVVVALAQLPARTMVSYVEVRPSEPKRG